MIIFGFVNIEKKGDIHIGLPGALLTISDRSSFVKLGVLIPVFSLSNIIFISGVTVKSAATIAGLFGGIIGYISNHTDVFMKPKF